MNKLYKAIEAIIELKPYVSDPIVIGMSQKFLMREVPLRLDKLIEAYNEENEIYKSPGTSLETFSLPFKMKSKEENGNYIIYTGLQL